MKGGGAREGDYFYSGVGVGGEGKAGEMVSHSAGEVEGN